MADNTVPTWYHRKGTQWSQCLAQCHIQYLRSSLNWKVEETGHISLRRGLSVSPGALEAVGKYPCVSRTVSHTEITHGVGRCVCFRSMWCLTQTDSPLQITTHDIKCGKRAARSYLSSRWSRQPGAPHQGHAISIDKQWCQINSYQSSHWCHVVLNNRARL